MLLRLLKYNTTIGYLLIPLLAAVAWLPALKSGSYRQMAFDNIQMPLYELLTGYLAHYTLASKLTALLLVILTGFYLIRFNNKYLFIKERTLLPAFFFILISSSLISLHRLHPVLIATVFFIAALDKLLDSYRTERLSYNYFEASFLIATGSLFYFNIIYFVVLIWLALLILRPVIWREWAFSVIGLTGPWLFFATVDYFMYGSLEWTGSLIARNFMAVNGLNLMLLPEKIFFSVMLLFIILASRKFATTMSKMKVLSRKVFMLFFWIYALCVLIYFLVETANVEIAIIATIPVAYLLSHFVLSLRPGFWSNAILWVTAAGTQIVVWLPWR